MLKLLYLQRRLPGLTRAEFTEHWLDVHARFARELPSVLRYVQYATLDDDPVQQALAQAADGREPYDGLTAAWFADEESFRRGMEHPLVAEALADERHFIDADRSVALLVEERVQVEPRGACPIVLVECLRRPADIDRATFSDRWHHHAEIGKKAASLGMLAGYIQNHALPEGEDAVAVLDELRGVSQPGSEMASARHPAAGQHGRAASRDDAVQAAGRETPHEGSSGESWDGVVTAYFESIAIAKALFASPLAAEEAFEDERSFIDHDKGVYMLARRHVAKDLVR